MTSPTYHDVHVTTPTMERTSIFNLPYRVILQCTRVGGWGLWARAEGALLNGLDAEPEQNLGEHGLRVDIAGVVIFDDMPRFPAVFRERAIERMIRWREMASDYEGADRLRERDPAELETSADMIEKTALRLHMGELE